MTFHDLIPRKDRRWHGHPARGVTLLELLIVLALLLAMAVAVGPTVLTTLDERAFDSAVDVTGRQMMLARAHAQAGGKPVEVLYVANESTAPQVVAREFVVDEADVRQPLTQSWAQRPLPFGFAIADQPPDVQESIGGIEAPATDGSLLRLALFLPDGSAMPIAPRWLSDGDGRAARMTVNPYTGSAEFTRLPPPDLRRPVQDEEDMPWDVP